MYIIERMISIAILLLITCIASIKLSKTNDYKKIKKILVFYVIIISILSFCYIPALTSDLTRLRIMMSRVYTNMSFPRFLEIIKTTSTYTTHIYYYVVAKIGIQELVSAFSSLINYSVICYVLYDYSKKHNIRGSSVANALMLYIFIGEYLEVVSGFRSMCSFSIFFFCIYREFFNNKNILSNIIFYLIAIGFHNAVVPLVIIRFIYLLFQKEKNMFVKIFNYFLFISLLLFSLKYGTTIIESTTNKANNYLDHEVFYYFWSFLSSVLQIVLVIYVYLTNKDIIKEKIPKTYRNLFIIILLLDMVFIFIEYSIFRRYSRVVIMLFLPIIMECFNYERLESTKLLIKKKNIIYYLLLVLIMLIEVSRGDLCGIKFFTLK